MKSNWERIDDYVSEYFAVVSSARRKGEILPDASFWVRRNVQDMLKYDVKRLIDKCMSNSRIIE